MLTQLQTAKLDRRFELLDLDGDGFITAADYDQAAANVCRAFEHPEGSPQYEKVHMTFLSLWDRLSRKMDGRRSGRISQKQFVASCADSIVQPEGGYDRIMRPVINAIFDIVDADGNGLLELEELVALFAAYGVGAHDAESAFRELDLDDNGVLDRDEVHRAIRDYYVSDDPDAPGNRIFGPLSVTLPQ